MASVYWFRTKDLTVSKSAIMLAQSRMRNEALQVLSTFGGATTSVFGGSVCKTILSEYAIGQNDELQQRLQLRDHSYHDLPLTQDHFPPIDMDLDVYIADPKNVSTCISDLQTHLQDNLPDYMIVLRPPDENYACVRIWIDTRHHPLISNVVRIQLDIVMDGTHALFPDFTCSQLRVHTSGSLRGEMSLFHPPGMTQWWTSTHRERMLSLNPRSSQALSLLGGSRDMHRSAIEAIIAQIQRKLCHALIFSFRRWSNERKRKNQSSTRNAYSVYVGVIVRLRLQKLLHAGFKVEGFLPSVAAGGQFVCTQGDCPTPLRSVLISSSAFPEAMSPPGKGLRFRDDTDTDHDTDHKTDHDTDHDTDQDTDHDTDQDTDHDTDTDTDTVEDPVKPYYWCDGCALWHEVVALLL
jgi:hypothetical protein